MNKRLVITYSGAVQNVGFRYTARSVAQNLGLTGWVRNVPDGTVEVVAEGEEKDLKEFIVAINEQMNHTHFSEQISWETGTGEFVGFGIKY